MADVQKPQNIGMEVDDEDEEDEDGEEAMSEEEKSDSLAKAAITGRCVTLQMLIAEKIIEPGPTALSLKYLGRRFIADLLVDGKIQMPGTKETFTSPSSWAMHCKRQVNPNKKSGCGWASVMYKGKKLDVWKAVWFRKHRPCSPARSQEVQRESPRSPWGSKEDIIENRSEQNGKPPSRALEESIIGEKKLDTSYEPLNLTPKPAHTSTPTQNGRSSSSLPVRSASESAINGYQEEALNLSMKGPNSSIQAHQCHETNNNSNDRISVKHSSLKKRSQNVDPNVLVECESFKNLGKIQPFSVSMATNAMILMDFHCHVTTSEVVGYLGGKWDQANQHLSIMHAYPCKCRLADSHQAATVEEEIRQAMQLSGLSLVGWYHSHPFCQADPSVKDIDCQMSYQLRMKGSGSTYFPCVGLIIAPYNRKRLKKDSVFRMFMVMPPLESEPSEYGIPMNVKYSVKQNPSVTEELLSEMKDVTDFYRGNSDWLKFRQSWQPSITYMEKLKSSLITKLPEDQMENGTFLDFVHHLVLPK